MVDAVDQEKIQRYRKLVQSLTDLGDSHAKAIQTKRHQLTNSYFVRCAGLVSGVVLLVENNSFYSVRASEECR
jgi:hypothetical protein